MNGTAREQGGAMSMTLSNEGSQDEAARTYGSKQVTAAHGHTSISIVVSTYFDGACQCAGQ